MEVFGKIDIPSYIIGENICSPLYLEWQAESRNSSDLPIIFTCPTTELWNFVVKMPQKEQAVFLKKSFHSSSSSFQNIQT